MSEHRRPSEPTIDLPPGAAPPAVRHGSGPHAFTERDTQRSPSYPSSPVVRDEKQIYTVAMPPTPPLPRYDSGPIGMVGGAPGDFKSDAGRFTDEPSSFYPGGSTNAANSDAGTMMMPGPRNDNLMGQQQLQQHQQSQAPLPMTPPQQHSQQHSQVFQQPAGSQHQMSSPPPFLPGQTSQPGATMPMQFSTRNPNNLPVKPNGERDWSSSLCACSNVGLCCLAWWCPCVVYGQLQTRLSHLNRNNAPHPTGGDGCGSDCLVHGTLTACCGIGWVLQIGQRTNVRNRYRISGNGCEDCLCAWCCTPCSLTQETQEVDMEEQVFRLQATPQTFGQERKI